jgi:hypothetical protein
MRDWQMEVGNRMDGLKLCSEVRGDIVRELACHFEQLDEDARKDGASEHDAREQALESVKDWKRFASEVQKEKETFMTTTPFKRRVVYPGMIALTLSAVALWITSVMHHYGSQYIFYVIQAPRYFVFNIPWLLALPVAGAVGAWFSWRHGGNTGDRASAALFPSLMYLAAILGSMLLSVIFITIITVFHIGPRPGDFRGATPMEWVVRILMMLTPWVFAPALSCLIGAMPFLWLKKQERQEHPTTEAHA